MNGILAPTGRGEREPKSPAALHAIISATLALALLISVSPAPALALDPVRQTNRIPVTIAATLTAPDPAPMHMPTDVALDSTGRAYVADGTSDRLVIFAPDGRFDRALSAIGETRLNRPLGLTLDATDRLWIADTGNHRLLIVSPDGREAAKVEVPTPDGGRPFEPTDIAVTLDGRRAYFTDNPNHRLGIRDNTTGAVNFTGRYGEALGQFRWPFMLAVTPDNYVFITDVIGARAQRLSPTDRWAGRIGEWGVELGQLYRPKGVAIDARGRVYIGDSSLGVVQVFDARGAVIGVLTDPTGRPQKFQHPMGMAFDPQGRLYVVELQANRVAVVTLPPGFVPPTPTTQPATHPAEEKSK